MTRLISKGPSDVFPVVSAGSCLKAYEGADRVPWNLFRSGEQLEDFRTSHDFHCLHTPEI